MIKHGSTPIGIIDIATYITVYQKTKIEVSEIERVGNSPGKIGFRISDNSSVICCNSSITVDITILTHTRKYLKWILQAMRINIFLISVDADIVVCIKTKRSLTDTINHIHIIAGEDNWCIIGAKFSNDPSIVRKCELS